MKTIVFNAMGSRIFIALDTEDMAAIDEAVKIQQSFEEWEQALSRFRISSELSQINRHPGVAHQMSRVFSEVMRAAEHANKISGGLVTPAILNALINVGYKNDFDELLERHGKDFEQALLAPMDTAKCRSGLENKYDYPAIRNPAGFWRGGKGLGSAHRHAASA